MKSAKNILQPEHRALKTALLVLNECSTLSFASAVDPMRAANRLADRPAFDWDYVTPTDAPVMLTSALAVTGIPLARLQSCDLMIVVAGFQMARQATPSLLAGLRRIAATGATMAGIDGGPWLLAEAGLLDGHTATTHWDDFDSFASRFPKVDVQANRFAISENRLTSGGAIPAVEMILHIIAARHGASFAARVSNQFLCEGAPAQTKTDAPKANHHSALTSKANSLMEAALDDPLPLAHIADRLGTSPRTLQQQFRLRLNTTPQDHYLQLRMAEARRLVTDTDMSLMDVAQATGFTSQSSFARAFRTAHGLSARDLRQDSAYPTHH
ncbi:GlxA family transcriptional regulator [Ruegeria sp.]|uniref:GlxA family transcriptional regulator n=1 Tax=Ruegeria sp. TaxID=1879320 RepID=UPI003B001554